MSTSVSLPLHHEVQEFSSGTSRKRVVKRLWCGGGRVPVLRLTCADCSGKLRPPVRVYLYYVSPALIAAGAVHVLAGAQQCSDSARREP